MRITLLSIQCLLPTHDELEHTENEIPPVSLYVAHMHLETQVGTSTDQLNVCLLNNISIVSHSCLNN